MTTQPTVDREFFQKLLASAFVVQQSRQRKVANTGGLAMAPLFGAQLPFPKLDEDILISAALLGHWASGLPTQDTRLATKAGPRTPPLTDEPPSAADSMDACSARFQVPTPELKTAQVRRRDPWTPLLLSLVIALALLLIWMLGRVTWSGTAHPQGPPLRVTSKPHAAPVPSTLDLASGSPSKAEVRLLRRVEPKYPDAAKQKHIQGLVVLEANVNAGGAVQQLIVISGNSMLATAASDAVRQWRFKPLVQKGRVVPFQTRVKVNFVLL